MNRSESPEDKSAAIRADIGTVGPSDGLRRSPAPNSPTIPMWPSAAPMLDSGNRHVDQLAPGQTFGSYEIVRLLGAGGMGQVYEAVQQDSGRRLALKLLMTPLSSDEDTKRFLREGRVAASLNHPNTVYVYGAELVEGNPVITMEMVRGGTLDELVEKRGPLPIDETIEFALDMIAGLKAAAAEGILHRDIKPANCFLDENGRVKVGDFGLSISSRGGLDTTLTATGAILGTPAFASPEQLRGAPLDLRSDIYSLGATLYYLLAGDVPFHAQNLAEYIAKVLESPAPPLPRARNKPRAPNVPPPLPGTAARSSYAIRELERIVRKCLEKNPNDRPQSYDDLEESLEALRRRPLQCPPAGRRTLATLVDLIVIFAIYRVMYYLYSQNTLQAPDLFLLLLTTAGALIVLLPELLFRASLGKLACGLRVVRANTARRLNAPTWCLILVRFIFFCVFESLSSLVGLIPFAIELDLLPKSIPAYDLIMKLSATFFAIVLLLPFATARTRNCYAGLHELGSSTRVVSRRRRAPAPAVPLPPSEPIEGSFSRVGPYTIVDRELPIPGVQCAYDPLLKRPVWIQWLHDAAAQVTDVRRDVARPGRLRWINAGNAGGRSWQAYSSVDGAPLLSTARSPQPWSRVRQWLLELTAELESASRDRTLPDALSIHHVWIDPKGRAILLDFPSDSGETRSDAGSVEFPNDAAWTSIQGFLDLIACTALGLQSGQDTRPAHPGRNVDLPLHARRALDGLAAHDYSSPANLIDALRAHADSPDRLTFPRRVQRLGAVGFVPLTMAITTIVTVVLPERRAMESNPEAFRAWLCMIAYNRVVGAVADGSPTSDIGRFEISISRRGYQKLKFEGNPKELKEAFEIYISSEFSRIILDPKFRNNRYIQSFHRGMLSKGEELVLRVGKPTDERARWARSVVEPIISSIREERNGMDYFLWNVPSSMLPIAFIDFLSQFVFRGGIFLFAFGGTLVGREGRQVSRLRAAARSLVLWLPVVAVWWCMSGLRTTEIFIRNAETLGPLTQVWTPQALALGYGLGALWMLTGRRGPHDLLCGTRVIAR